MLNMITEQLYDVLNKYKRRIDARIDKYLQIGENQILRSAMRYYPLGGKKTGKRLRPICAMLVADAISKRGFATIPFGICIELIHNFTLVHDDIIDKDEWRHGERTAHIVYGVETAINTGDALFARAFEILGYAKYQPEITTILLQDVATTVRKIAEGQQWDMDFEKRFDITEDAYLKMIGYKTAALFQLATKGGALIAGGSKKQIKNMAEYGRLIGLGFQIQDDLLDVTGDAQKRGKDFGSDIRNGKRTIIVCHALHHMSTADKKKFLNIFGSKNASLNDIKNAVMLLEKIGSIQYAASKASEFSKKAQKMLAVLEDSKYKDTLYQLTSYMVTREK
jgi:geranylgeranyl diphosphate synthase type I